MKDNTKMIIKNNEDLKIKKKLYKEAVASGDVYTACLFFSDIRDCDDPSVFLAQAGLYSKYSVLINYQVKYLLKVLTFEKFTNYIPSAVFNDLIKYFVGVRRIDVAQHYAQILGKIFEDKVSIKLIKAPKNVLAETKLRVVDDDFVGAEGVSVLASLGGGTSDSLKSGVTKTAFIKQGVKDGAFAKVLECYDLIDRGDIKQAQDVVWDIIKDNPQDPEVIAVLYRIAQRNEEYRERNIEFIKNFKNETKDVLVDLVKVEVYAAEEMIEQCLSYIDQISPEVYDSYITFFAFAKVRCLVHIGRVDEAVELLKFIVAIDPKDFSKRFALKKLARIVDGKGIVDEREIFGIDLSEMYEELISFLTLEDEDFAKVSRTEFLNCMNYLSCVSSIEILRMLVQKMVKANMNLGVLLEFLIDPESSELFKEMLMRVLLEVGYGEKIYYLANCKLKSFVPSYPSNLYQEVNFSDDNCTGQDVMKALICEYAVACLKLVRKGYDLNRFAVFVEEFVKKLNTFQCKEFEQLKKEGVASALFLQLFSEKEGLGIKVPVPKRIFADLEALKNIYCDYN